jgi:hypothetical protein
MTGGRNHTSYNVYKIKGGATLRPFKTKGDVRHGVQQIFFILHIYTIIIHSYKYTRTYLTSMIIFERLDGRNLEIYEVG